MKKYACSILMYATVAMAAVASPQPNIILAMADDMGWGDPSYNSLHVTYTDGTPHPDQGWINTPTLDAMAASGVRFDRFYSAAPVCSPTRASCLTGRNPYRLGITKANKGHLEMDETPLSEILSAAGYSCGHFGKWHLGTLTTLRYDSNRGKPGETANYSAPWHHDYDSCFVTEASVPTWHPYRIPVNGTPLPTSFSDTNFNGTHYWRMPTADYETAGEGDVVPVEYVNNAVDGDDSRMLARESIDFMRSAVSNSEPFFLVLWFHTPHRQLVDPEEIEDVESSDALKDAIEDMDEALAMVRNELGVLGVQSNTMFWVTSDNGPEDGTDSPNEIDPTRPFRSGRFRERKRWLYDGGIRVPGILEWPNVVTNAFATDYPAVTSDYYPTILDYLGLSAPTQRPLDGVSLRPVIEGAAGDRPKPMGFLYPGTQSWVADRYKIISIDGTTDGWELYDMDNTPFGEDVEENALATASTIGTQPPELQTVYNSMIAEYNAWRSSVDVDSAYIHSSQPTAELASPFDTVVGPFSVTVVFSEAVSGLEESDFVIENGSITNLTGDATNWTFTVVAAADGTVTVSLPEGAAFDVDGNPSAEANSLSVFHGVPPGGEVVGTNLIQLVWQTVDADGNVPGNQDNNLEKFSTPEGAFTTTLYTRGAGTSPLRRVRIFSRFDLSALLGKAVTSAYLEFNGYSLNDNTAADLEVVALASDWAVSGTPLPTFEHATAGSAVNGGSIISDLGSGLAKDYSVDVTEMVANWASGTWVNHGLRIQLADVAANNGLGIKTSGMGAIQLRVAFLTEASELQLSPESELAISLEAPATVATGTVDASFIYGSDSNYVEITSVEVIQQQHPGAFRVVGYTPPMELTDPAPASETLYIEFDQSGTGLAEGQSSTGLVEVVWNETGGNACTNLLPVVLSYFAHIDESCLLQNNFDGDGSNDIGPDFEIQSINNPQNTGLSDASTGVVSFSAPSDSRPNVTLVSSSPLDLSANYSFTVTWNLESIASDAFTISKNGLFLGVQNKKDDAWNNVTSLGIGIRSSAGAGDLDLVYGKGENKGSESPLLASGTLADASIQDGFTVALTVNYDNTWSVSTTGLSTNINASGTLSHVTYSEVASTLFASTALQLNKNVALHTLTHDSVSVTLPVEGAASSAILQIDLASGGILNIGGSNLTATATYMLQGRTNLLEGIWDDIATTTGVTQAGWNELVSTNNSMYYRIHASP